MVVYLQVPCWSCLRCLVAPGSAGGAVVLVAPDSAVVLAVPGGTWSCLMVPDDTGGLCVICLTFIRNTITN